MGGHVGAPHDQDCRACRGEWPDAAALIADCGPAVAYLNEDQFFPGWTVLVLKRHATELYELARDERIALMEAVSDVARALAAVFEANKMNYELLGNQLAHIHWHLVPRRADDPIPRQPAWMLEHPPRVLPPAERRARIDAIRACLPR
jgi:diadenosine tetraphosphate (Ap4A) HIT family hydrolase